MAREGRFEQFQRIATFLACLPNRLPFGPLIDIKGDNSAIGTLPAALVRVADKEPIDEVLPPKTPLQLDSKVGIRGLSSCVDRQSLSNATGSEQGMVLNHGLQAWVVAVEETLMGLKYAWGVARQGLQVVLGKRTGGQTSVRCNSFLPVPRRPRARCSD